MKRMRLFTDEDILSRFEKRIEKAVRVHIATAWATPGKQLDALKQKKGLEVRAIVGTHGNATKPSALKLLKKLGELRLARDKPLFHPKVYVFEFKSGKLVAWSGSANFTRAGFGDGRYGGGNVEVVYETDDVEPFLEWFEQQWSQLEPATGEEINEYKKRRRRNPPSRKLRNLVGESEGAAPGPSLPPFARTGKWKPVLEPKEIRSAFNQMRKTLIKEAEKFRRMVGGQMRTVYWHDDLGYWCAFRNPPPLLRNPSPRPREYWNPFGTENPREADHLGSGCLQINHGHGQHGPFVRNRGDTFLARDLGAIRGVNNPATRRELEKRLKKRLPGRVVDVRWGDRTRRMVILSEVGSGELRKTVAELVKLVAELGAAED